jgi:hypothetical protein
MQMFTGSVLWCCNAPYLANGGRSGKGFANGKGFAGLCKKRRAAI